MRKKTANRGGNEMTREERLLIVETLGEMRQLKGEMIEFKEHVIGRVQRLEKKESDRSKTRMNVFSVLIATAALAVTIFINFFKRG
jgi:hypothetical protein